MSKRKLKAYAEALTDEHKRDSEVVVDPAVVRTAQRVFTPEGYEALKAKGRANAMRQSAANQARNISEGKPPLRYEAEGRSLGVHTDQEADDYWMAEGTTRGLITPDMGRAQARRTAFRLAEVAASELVNATDGSDELTERFLEAEVEYWIARAADNDMLRRKHLGHADTAARKLATLRHEAERDAR